MKPYEQAPASAAQVILWVLGEYGTLADIGTAGVLSTLGALAEEQQLSDRVRGYLLTAMAKLVAQVISKIMLRSHWPTRCK